MNVGNGIEGTVMSVVSVIPDPLHGNHRRHRVHDMVFAAIVSVMCGFASYRMFEAFAGQNLAWFRAHGCPFANGVPGFAAFPQCARLHTWGRGVPPVEYPPAEGCFAKQSR